MRTCPVCGKPRDVVAREPKFIADMVTHLLVFPRTLRSAPAFETTAEAEAFIDRAFLVARGETERIGNQVLGNRPVGDMTDDDMLRVIEVACRRALRMIDPDLYGDLPE